MKDKRLKVAQVYSTFTEYDTAQLNFYLKCLKSVQNVKVYQLFYGVWVELSVAEVRDDHVVVDMTSLGTLAFVELPAAAAQAE